MQKKRVLILCTANSARSQMAHGLLNDLASDQFDVFSAGTKPSQVNPFAIEAMQQVGIDISHHTSDGIDLYINQSFDYVITVCDKAAETCPIFPGPAHRLPHRDEASWSSGAIFLIFAGQASLCDGV